MTDPSLHRTNLNLYLTDVAWLTHTYGYGWTQQARDLLHMKIEEIKANREQSHETNVDSGANTPQSNPSSTD